MIEKYSVSLRSARPVWVLFAALLCAMPSRGQVLYGSITGNVTDATGAAVPGATVEALNTATGVSKRSTSDARGVYLISDLQAGQYKVSISAPSFATVVQTGVTLAANTVRRVDAQMQVAQVNQTVTVDASAAVLQTDRADVNTQVGQAELENLPIGGQRVFQSLYKLVPGSTPPRASHSEAGNPQGALAVNVNGVSYNNNNTRIDGTADLYPWLPEIVAYVPPAEAIEQVNVETATFDAEQGMAGGSVVNVAIKSGTNQFHGSAWEYNTISSLKARNFFYYGANNPKYILNQFGLAGGGPIVKNKLFFFSDWERTERRQSLSNFFTVPNDALQQGDFTGTGTTVYDPSTGSSNGAGRSPFANNRIPTSRIASASAKMAALLPQPNQPNYPNDDLFAAGSYSFSRDNVDIKINYNPNEKTSVFGRYSISKTNIFDPQALGAAGGPAIDGGQPGNAPSTIQSAAIGGTYSVTPTLLFDGNVGYLRQYLGAQNVDIDKNYGLDVLGIPGTNGSERLQGGYPNFRLSGFTSLGNQNVSNPFLFRDNVYTTSGNGNWQKGSHAIRFGAEIDHYGINHFQPQATYGPRGGFTFSGGVTALAGGVAPNLYNSWADFLLGQPQAMGKDYQYINPATVRENSYAVYIRDQWQVNRRLTINYGLRWEFYPFAHRDHFGGDLYDPSNNNVYLGGINGVPYNTYVDTGWGNLAPRLGIAYRLNDKTVIRTGFGISVDPNNFRNLRDAYPAIISQQFTGATSYTPAGDLVTGIPALVGPDINQGILPLPANIRTTTFPKDYNRGYIESYNFTLQRDLGSGYSVQVGYVGTRAIRQTASVNINAAPPNTGKAGQPLYILYGNSTSISSIQPFNTSTYNALQAQFKRRFTGGVQLGVIYTYSRAVDYADNNDSGLTFAWVGAWARNKALAGFDRTHNFQTYATYELPFGRGKRWITGGAGAAILGGWQLNTVLSKTSGTPFTVGSSGASLNAPGNSQTADQVLSDVLVLGGHGPNEPYFDPYAFAPVTEKRFGTSGRDILRGPGAFNLDASVFRTFRMTERFHLQFRAEAFGLTNTPSFNNPSATVSNATIKNGTITNYNGYTIISSASGERQLRFALKLSF